MRVRIYPLTFEPVFRDYVWGGRHLETLFSRRLPPGIVAESWEISGHASSPTRVDAGTWQGRTLPEVLAALGRDLVGRHAEAMLARGKFPLLVKLLDANLDLSLQVHPDDAYASVYENGELGKTEMWYVLHAEPGTELIYGLRSGITRDSLRAAIAHNTLETQVQRLSVAVGDCFFIPAGTVHALLAGAVVAEIQQNSDTTYRVSDWGRLGADGKPRPLHVDKALDVINFEQAEPQKVLPTLLAQDQGVTRHSLTRCPQFTVEQVEMAEGATYEGQCDGATFEIWGCVTGNCQVNWTGDPAGLEAVRFVLLPAVLGRYTIHAQRASILLRAYIEKSGGQA
jgi:mannose-6-phosphate isomerase